MAFVIMPKIDEEMDALIRNEEEEPG